MLDVPGCIFELEPFKDDRHIGMPVVKVISCTFPNEDTYSAAKPYEIDAAFLKQKLLGYD